MSDRLPPTPTLECDRLVLRPLRMEDAPIIQRRFPQWEIVRFLNAGNVPWPYPADGAAGHIADCLEEMARGKKLYWAVALKSAPDELIGRIDLRPDDGRSRDMRGFWLDLEHHGKGFMTEAAERVTGFAFTELGWPHLWLSNDERNLPPHASRRSRAPSWSIASRAARWAATACARSGGSTARRGSRGGRLSFAGTVPLQRTHG